MGEHSHLMNCLTANSHKGELLFHCHKAEMPPSQHHCRKGHAQANIPVLRPEYPGPVGMVLGALSHGSGGGINKSSELWCSETKALEFN